MRINAKLELDELLRMFPEQSEDLRLIRPEVTQIRRSLEGLIERQKEIRDKESVPDGWKPRFMPGEDVIYTSDNFNRFPGKVHRAEVRWDRNLPYIFYTIKFPGGAKSIGIPERQISKTRS